MPMPKMRVTNTHGLEIGEIARLAAHAQKPYACQTLTAVAMTLHGILAETIAKTLGCPPGIEGITSIIDQYIDSVNDKLAADLDFDPEANVIRRALLALAELMVEKDNGWLRREEARRALDAVHPPAGFEKSLFNQLISERLLRESKMPVGPGGQRCNRVRLSYQLLSDHMVAEYLIDQHVGADESSRAFAKGGPLGQLVSDEDACCCNRGVIEALSI